MFYWIIYVLVCTFISYILSNFIPPKYRVPFFVVFMTVLVTPSVIQSGSNKLAPAIFVFMYDLIVELNKNVSISDVNTAMKEASEGEMKGLIEYSSVPLVSSDIIGNASSSIFDASSTQLLGKSFVKVVAWYDNEWGYSNRIVDLVKLVIEKEKI